jgi:hypothetical protein
MVAVVLPTPIPEIVGLLLFVTAPFNGDVITGVGVNVEAATTSEK